MEQLNVRLGGFEGPLDLLYHLIEKNEIDIYDIPITELTEQYMEFLTSHNMDSISEFILMAATLLEIKSKMLLPLPKKDDPTQDPRQELVERLIEYKRFKQAAEAFKSRGEFAEQYIFRPPDEELIATLRDAREQSGYEVDSLLEGISIDQLFKIFESVILRRELKTDKIRGGFNSVRRETFTVDDKIDFIKSLLNVNRRLNFYDIFGISKLEKVVTFLAVLELIKREEIGILQENPFDDIFIINKGVNA